MPNNREVRFNLEVPQAIKKEIRTEAKRRGKSMTAVILDAWRLYQRCRHGDLYTVVKNERTKLEVL